MTSLWKRRRKRQRDAIERAQQALASPPEIGWHDEKSEALARERLQAIASIVDRALQRVSGSSDEARALKYAQVRLTAWLQGWGDPELIPPTHVFRMYEDLKVALRALSARLVPDNNPDAPRNPDEPPPRS